MQCYVGRPLRPYSSTLPAVSCFSSVRSGSAKHSRSSIGAQRRIGEISRIAASNGTSNRVHLQPEDPEDPYPTAAVATDPAEDLFRWALSDGELRAYVHNARTGVDLELDRRGWRKSGEQVGINSDYSDSQMPGPEFAIDGILQPIFLFRTEFELWLLRSSEGAKATQPGEVQSRQTDRNPILATRAFSIEDVMARIGLSKTKLYEEIERGNLQAKKRAAHVP